MSITLYELAGADDQVRFSPHCWKSHLALNHKQLDFAAVPVRYDEIKTALAFADYQLLPVLKDGEQVITDSWRIACYLEEQYPTETSLFGDAAGKVLAESTNQWCDTQLAKYVRPLILLDVYHLLAEKDKAYFRESREAKLGMTLEAFAEKASEALPQFREELNAVRELLSMQPYLGGDQPRYADICLLGSFLWIACVNDVAFLADDDHIMQSWYQRMLNVYPQAQQAINYKSK